MQNGTVLTPSPNSFLEAVRGRRNNLPELSYMYVNVFCVHAFDFRFFFF